MTKRYYAPNLADHPRLYSLLPEEASHASRVMRAKVGDSITLFDGNGNEAAATVRSIGKRDCVVEVGSVSAVDREPSCASHFFLSLPKPERSKEMVERLTEMGVASFTPIICERTQRPPSDAMLEKLRRIVVEACKQCGRNQLLSIEEPLAFGASIEAYSAKDPLAEDSIVHHWMAHPGGSPLWEMLHPSADLVRVWIGPEGGFSDAEISTGISAGLTTIDLGKRIYRIETAACAIASLLGD